MASDLIYKFFADYIYKETGILYAKSDYYRLDMRFNAMVRELEVDSIDQVYKLYKAGVTKELHTLIVELATNNETYFMRDKKPFKALTKGVMPKIIEEATVRNFKIWCAGCSTGQEVYSVLMSIDKDCGEDILKYISIDASDISAKALGKGSNGNYDGLEVQRGLPAAMLMDYFTQNANESWDVIPRLKNKVNFFEHNLLTGIYPRNTYDVIFCRNVLIYQDIENKTAILEQFYSALKPGGYIILGSGETLIGTNLSYKQRNVEGTIIYQKEESSFTSSIAAETDKAV